jgi:hypothetical protein
MWPPLSSGNIREVTLGQPALASAFERMSSSRLVILPGGRTIMNASVIESFDELGRRLGWRRSSATAQATQRVKLFAYPRENGCHVGMAVDFSGAIASLSGHEEPTAHCCREGGSVSHASEGRWLLFRFGEPVIAPTDVCDVVVSLSPVGYRTC